MADSFKDFFKEVPAIKLREPLAEVLGAFKLKAAVLEYSFTDTVKMSGHACPTVSSAYICCRESLKKLYPRSIPVRGNIAITVYSEPDDGVYGVMAQVFSFITGACTSTGFKGLGYKFKRKNLITFNTQKPESGAMCFTFKRIDNGTSITAKIYPCRLPSLGEGEQRMSELLERIIWEAAKEKDFAEFQELWNEKVKRIVVEEEGIDNWLQLQE